MSPCKALRQRNVYTNMAQSAKKSKLKTKPTDQVCKSTIEEVKKNIMGMAMQGSTKKSVNKSMFTSREKSIPKLR